MEKIIPYRKFTDELYTENGCVHSFINEAYPITRTPPAFKKPEKKAVIIEVMPWEPMPKGHQDFRPLLQRDGLILQGWHWRGSEIKIVWLTTGRRNMSKYEAIIDNEAELVSICPQRRYNDARFGYYQEEEPDFIIYTAPADLTADARGSFIQKLREAGVNVNFNKDFTLGGQRREKEQAIAAAINSTSLEPSSFFSGSNKTNFFTPIDMFISELYADGTVNRWHEERDLH